MATIDIWFTIGTLGMALGTIVLAAGLRVLPRSVWRRYSILIAVPAIAVVAYAMMSLGIGSVESPTGGVVYIPRYVDWLLTTPLHILYLGLFAGAAGGVIGRAVGLQTATIVFGMAAALSASPLKWILYAAGLLSFAGVVYHAYGAFGDAADRQTGTAASLYRKLRAFLVVLWLVYPLIWLVGPNSLALMDVETTALVVTYIDIVSKVGLGLIALNGQLGFADADAATAVSGD